MSNQSNKDNYTEDDTESEQSVIDKELSSTIQMAIDDVVEESGNEENSTKLTRKVLDKLEFYFVIMDKMKEDEEFVDEVSEKAKDLQNIVGGNFSSAIRQVLESSYKTFIHKELDIQLDEDRIESIDGNNDDDDDDDNKKDDEMDITEDDDDKGTTTDDDDTESRWSAIRQKVIDTVSAVHDIY